MTSIKKKSRFFAVRRGRRVGIYTDYAEYQEQVLGYSGFEARTFYSRPRAEKWLKERQQEEQEEQEEQARRLAAMSIHDTGKNNTANDKNDSKNPNDKNKNHKNKNGKNPNESASKKGSPRPFLKSAASNQRADPLATIGELLPPQKPAESADSAGFWGGSNSPIVAKGSALWLLAALLRNGRGLPFLLALSLGFLPFLFL
mmetsp:Transcript_5449/g.15491  ORF Transcript_5449/g.15491 Transcript_5449/m.15491 type:complete len:201 (+) Transcript_5449:132-734(+)